MKSLQTLENKRSEALATLHWSTLSSRRYKHRCVFIYKCTNGLIDFDFNLRTNHSIHSYNTRSCENLHLPKDNMNWGKHKPFYPASKDFYNLDESVRNSNSLYRFKSLLNSRPMYNYSLFFFYPTLLLFLYYRVSIDIGNYSFSILLCRRDVVFYNCT